MRDSKEPSGIKVVSSANFVGRCIVDYAIDESDILPDKPIFKESSLIVIYKVRQNVFQSVRDSFGRSFVVTV